MLTGSALCNFRIQPGHFWDVAAYRMTYWVTWIAAQVIQMLNVCFNKLYIFLRQSNRDVLHCVYFVSFTISPESMQSRPISCQRHNGYMIGYIISKLTLDTNDANQVQNSEHNITQPLFL